MISNPIRMATKQANMCSFDVLPLNLLGFIIIFVLEFGKHKAYDLVISRIIPLQRPSWRVKKLKFNIIQCCFGRFINSYSSCLHFYLPPSCLCKIPIISTSFSLFLQVYIAVDISFNQLKII